MVNGEIDKYHNLCHCGRIKYYRAKRCKVCFCQHKRGGLSYGHRKR